MKDQKVKHSSKAPTKKNAGFYIALALCIAAIGGAAWTTYSSVLDYQTPKEESSAVESSEQSEKEVGKSVSGIEYSNVESSSEQPVESSNDVSSEEESSEEESSVDESSVDESSVDESSDNPVSDASNETVRPLEGKVIKGYSPENPIYSKSMGDWRVHDGIDIAADDGEKVRAFADGTVKSVYNDELWGYTVKIEHSNGITMSYSGLSPTTLVKEGDSVSAGDAIGAVFTVPSEIMDETHLHLTAERDGKTIDPQALLDQNR